jgi:methyl-accepting chemotaxis protein
MSLQRLLRLLPIGLVVLVSLNMAMLLVQDRQSRATFDEVRVGQVERDLLGKIRTDCEAVTFKAVAWTLTRRNTQGRQYQDGKKACLDAVDQAAAAMPRARPALVDLKDRLVQLATLLEAIQSEHTDETKMVTVGRLEREVQPLTSAVHKNLDDLTRAADDESARVMAEALTQQERALWLGGLAGLLAIAVGALLAHVVTRRILTSVGEAATVASALADGDLAVAPIAGRDDEIGKLVAAMDRARKAWITAIGDIHNVTRHIAEAADDIADDAGTLNERSVHAATNLRETAHSMTALLSTVEASAASARRASELAGSATGSAHEGEAAVGEVVKTMDDLSAASSKIGEIVAVIDSIAFQTNLLALNAAVEAARAGEQGRGFAVVASEVRALAQRSADAAKEIKSLISRSTLQVEAGVELVGSTGAALSRIVEQVAEAARTVSGIANSANEQANGLQEVNTAVGQMDQITQQNAAMVEEATAASHSLKSEAEYLKAMIDQFRTNKSSADVASIGRDQRTPARARKTAASAPLRSVGSAALNLKPAAQLAGEVWTDF